MTEEQKQNITDEANMDPIDETTALAVQDKNREFIKLSILSKGNEHEREENRLQIY